LAPGVFIRNLDPAANQSFIVFDTYVVVFDAGSVAEARVLKREIEARTNKPVRYVINSHFHPDHSAGAAVFAAAGAEVVAAAAAKEAFDNWVVKDFAAKVKDRPAEYAGVVYAPPTRWIEQSWTLDDGVQRLELIHYGPGHTAGDLIGWMPRQRILFAQDLSTNGQHNLANANLSGWIAVLEKLRALGATQVVPGHKALAGPEILDRSYRYLSELRSQVRDLVARGLTYDQIMKVIDIPMYEEWSGVSVRNEPTHVLRAYQEAGGKLDDGRPFVTRRRLAALLGLGVLALASIGWLRLRGRRV
jgi:glyoxylase-like metal-dependent hydrolase (beta-lactamase superfamily II)